ASGGNGIARRGRVGGHRSPNSRGIFRSARDHGEISGKTSCDRALQSQPGCCPSNRRKTARMNFDTSPDNIARMAARWLRLEPPPTEAEIEDVLARLAGAFGPKPDQVLEARRLLHARFSIRMEMGQTIKVDEHAPWLAARRASIDP